MKQIVFLVLFAALFAACSSPKYSYNFSYHDYNSGKKSSLAGSSTATQETPGVAEQPVFTASAEVAQAEEPIVRSKPLTAYKAKELTREERKEVKKQVKAEIKKIMKNPNKIESIKALKESKQWDYDLKMAAIFGAVGIVLTALGGSNDVFWVLGAIALIVAIVFLIKWLARQ